MPPLWWMCRHPMNWFYWLRWKWISRNLRTVNVKDLPESIFKGEDEV